MPKQKSMNTRMARAFFRHYEHKHQFMKQFLDPARQPAPVSPQANFSPEFTIEFV
jgi:hypothetical protein